MRRAFAGLAIVQLVAVTAQFFLAGSGAFDPAPNEESFQPHRAFGSGIILLAVLLTVAAAAARVPGRLIGMSGLIAGLTVLQVVIGAVATALDGAGGVAGPGELVFGLHAINALAILGLTARIARQAGRLPQPDVPQRQAP